MPFNLKEKTPLCEIQEGRAYEIETSDSCDPITGREYNKHKEIFFIEKITGETCKGWNMTEQRAEAFQRSTIRFFAVYRPDI